MRFITFIVFTLFIASCSNYNKVTEKTTIKPPPKTAANRIEPVKTNKKMIKIDGGNYMGFMGKDSGRLVSVKSFEMDDSPITVSEYLEFLKRNPQWTKSKVKRLFADDQYLHNWQGDFELPKEVDPDAPVTNISWFAARAYAKSVGKRLPTVDEWEYVGLADENSKNASDDPEFTEDILAKYKRKKRYREPVKSEAPNYYGLYDIYGLVWEWTEDFNSVMMSGESRSDSALNETLFCSGAALTTSDLKNYAAFIRYAMRGSLKADYTVNNLGFRCVRDL